MDQNEKKAIYAKFDALKKEASELRTQLHSLNSQKEEAFNKKKEISQKIRALITDIKDSRSTRDEFTKQVADSKGRRSQFNEELHQKIEEAKKLNKERTDIIKKHKIKGDPAQLKEEIDRLDRRVETEGLSFDKEQKVMKEIKEKKRLYEEAKKISTVFDRMHALNKEIEHLRQKADEAHRKIQEKASASQEQHEEVVGASKEINALRDQEKEITARCMELKQRFQEMSSQLIQKQDGLNALKEQIDGVKQEHHVATRKREASTLRQKQQRVEEKMRRGEKLTTEDLIVMQGVDSHPHV